MAKAGIFTEHVRLLALGTSLPAEHFDALWQALRAVLVSELRKRSLWNASPAYLVGQETRTEGSGSWGAVVLVFISHMPGRRWRNTIAYRPPSG